MFFESMMTPQLGTDNGKSKRQLRHRQTTATPDKQQLTTDKQQLTTDKQQLTTDKQQPTTRNKQ